MRNHICFVIFMSLLLIAPKIPLRIPGGAERSSVSLGLAGLMIWFLACPKRPFSFPRIGAWHPLFWILIFAIYAFVVSLLSGSIVSIAYSVQFLGYVCLGAILMRRYATHLSKTDWRGIILILLAIAIVYSITGLISVFTGPLYPHQTTTGKHWGGFYIPRGLSFSGNANMAGVVVVFFISACIYLYRGKTWKKWILLCLLLLALLATLSRSAIISFLLALIFICCLDNLRPVVQRASIKVLALKNMGFVISALSILVILIGLGIYLVNKPFLLAILSGFGLSQGYSTVSSDTSLRFGHWAWGMDMWASQSLLKMIFGGGFRSSMLISAGRGTWHTAHNMYITILGDFGVVGLTLFLAGLFGAFFRYARLFLTGKAGRIEKFGLMAVLALSIQNMTEVFLYSPVCLSLLIFVFAVTL